MLVVPVILLEDGLVVDHLGQPGSAMDCSFADPVKMARLWRVQNAAVIHLVDRASTEHGKEIDFESINRITGCLDIPIQLEAGFTAESATYALKQSRVARLAPVVHSLPDGVFDSIVENHGPNKICPIVEHGTSESQNTDAHIQSVGELKEAGCRRLIIRDASKRHSLEGHDTDTLTAIAKAYPRLRFSAAGGVGSYRDLKLLELESPKNVDSVIINRALYENRFPCQNMWCWHSKEQVDLQKFSSAKLKS